MTEPTKLQAGATTLLGPPRPVWVAALILAVPLLTLALLAGCGDKEAAVNVAADDQTAPANDYRPAPELLGGGMQSDGRVQLFGSATPGAVVRLRSPSGAQQFATADARGVWRFTLAPSPQPRLLGLSMSDKGQIVQAVSYLFLSPDGVVARLKAGGGTQAAAPGKSGLAAAPHCTPPIQSRSISAATDRCSRSTETTTRLPPSGALAMIPSRPASGPR